MFIKLIMTDQLLCTVFSTINEHKKQKHREKSFQETVQIFPSSSNTMTCLKERFWPHERKESFMNTNSAKEFFIDVCKGKTVLRTRIFHLRWNLTLYWYPVELAISASTKYLLALLLVRSTTYLPVILVVLMLRHSKHTILGSKKTCRLCRERPRKSDGCWLNSSHSWSYLAIL